MKGRPRSRLVLATRNNSTKFIRVIIKVVVHVANIQRYKSEDLANSMLVLRNICRSKIWKYINNRSKTCRITLLALCGFLLEKVELWIMKCAWINSDLKHLKLNLSFTKMLVNKFIGEVYWFQFTALCVKSASRFHNFIYMGKDDRKTMFSWNILIIL